MKKIIIGALVSTLLYVAVRYGLNFLSPGTLPDLDVMVISSIAFAMVISSLLYVSASYQLSTGFNLAWLAIIVHTLWFQPIIWQDKIFLVLIFCWLVYSLAFILYYFLFSFSQPEKKSSLIVSVSTFLGAIFCLLIAQYLIL